MSRKKLSDFLSALTLGPAQKHQNLTVVPILAPDDSPSGLLTLDDALDRGVAEITEVSEQGSVPVLRFLNHGPDPILLIDGEELVGAKQNRILNISILAPGRQSLEIPVSCVEQGRWGWQARRFGTSNRTIYAKLRRANVETVTANLRLSGRRHADQERVWNGIAEKAQRLDVRSNTGAASALFEQHEEALDTMVQSLNVLPRQVGAVFLVNGRLAGLEMFAAPDLLTRLLPKVARGYALDTLDDEELPLAGTPNPAATLASLTDARITRHRGVGLGEDLRLKARDLVGAGLIADGKVIHLTAYAANYA